MNHSLSRTFVLLAGVSLALYVGCSGDSKEAGQNSDGTIANTTTATGAGDGSVTTTGATTGAPTTGSTSTTGTTGACLAGQTECGGSCVTTATDSSNCGGCGNQCSAGGSCVAGQCTCEAGLTTCVNGCVDTQSDSANCGGCGNACPQGQVCSLGACAAGCAGNLTECSQSCVDLMTNTSNCGQCGMACPQGETCEAGSCGCSSGTLCGNECVDTTQNNSHCGQCSNACQGGQTCDNGICGCADGQTACGDACVDFQTDNAHCGSCENSCSETSSCQNGECGCPNGQSLCDESCIDTQSDPQNCGDCGNSCPSGSCSGGSCAPLQTEGVIGWASVAGDGVDTTTGGAGGEVVSVNSASALSSAASGNTARIIEVSGSISIAALDVGSNKTIVGVDANATFNGGININGESNVIIQNLHINASSSTADGDGIHVQNSHHVWVDHVEIWDAADGNLDINDRSNWITVSWSIFRYTSNPPDDDHRYSNLIGSGDTVTTDRGRLKVTWHHDWWSDRVHERMPRVRFGQVHVFNSYYSASGNNYCVRAGVEANILLENNYFEGVDTPHEIDASGAIIEEHGSTYSATTGATDRSGTAFDPPYPYTLDAPDAARTAIMANAGPQ